MAKKFTETDKETMAQDVYNISGLMSGKDVNYIALVVGTFVSSVVKNAGEKAGNKAATKVGANFLKAVEKAVVMALSETYSAHDTAEGGENG